MSASWDVSTTIAKPAASTATRERARSAVLDRFDAADARRQFRLDQADEARADRASRTARNRDDGRDGSSTRRSDVTEGQRAADRGQADTTRTDRTVGTKPSNIEAQDRSRSSAPYRADAADARRPSSLKQAEEPVADRAGRTAQTDTEASRTSSEPSAASERQDLPVDVRNASQGTGTPPATAPRAARSNALNPRSTASRLAPQGTIPDADTATAPTVVEGEKTGTDEAAEAEAVPSDDTARGTDATGGIPAAPQPVAPSTATAGLAPPRPSPALQGASMPKAGDAQTPAVEPALTELAGTSPGGVGEMSKALAAPRSTEASQPSPAGLEADFAAILDAVDPMPAAGTGVSAPEAAAAAKAATGPESPSAPSPTQASAPPVPLGAVPMTIALRALRDANRFEIRLDPVELGRIDVKLDIDRDAGTVSADLVVDRPATLALLQRDASTLQQALSQAGLDASAGISLSLRDGNGGGQDRGGTARHQAGTGPGAPPQDRKSVV